MQSSADKKTFFFEIGRGQSGHAGIGKFRSVSNQTQTQSEIIAACVENDALPDSSQCTSDQRPIPSRTSFPDWAILAERTVGDHAYVIRLEKGFGKGVYFDEQQPIASLSAFCAPNKSFISDVKAYCAPGERNPRWASFVFNCQDVLEHRVAHHDKALSDAHRSEHDVLELPLHLSVFDANTQMPAWMSTHHHHSHGQKLAYDLFHPGFHPPHFVSPLVVELDGG